METPSGVIYVDTVGEAAAYADLPDPDLIREAYALGPAAEVWGDAVHPVTGLTLAAHRDADQAGSA